MTRPLRIQYPDAYYHVTCRGNERRVIFRDKEDLHVFLELLARSLNIFTVNLLSYALMPNHFHLLVCTPKENLSDFMRHFNISYTGTFNRKYKRSGHLYHGRYKAFLIDADNYLLEVSRYIHLNPLRMKSREPQEQRWLNLLQNDSTSLPGYINQRNRKDYVHYNIILNYFGQDVTKSRKEYRKFIEEGFRKEQPNPLEKGKGTGIIGKDEFIDEIKQLFGEEGKITREQPALRELSKGIKPRNLIDQYAELVQVKVEELTRKGKQSPERAMLMELLYRMCKVTQPEIGKLLGGIDYSSVSQARKRLRKKVENDAVWRRRFDEVQDELGKCQ